MSEAALEIEEVSTDGFRRYTHVERLGTTEVNGILDGVCYVFPKIDGTNASVWMEEGAIQAGSRNRKLSLDNDNAGFMAAVSQCPKIQKFFAAHPDKRLYGEWLVPHSLKNYREDAWRKFYVFDVLEGEKHLDYNTYSAILNEFEIDYVPAIFFVTRPTEERIFNALQENNFLIKDGEGIGEGVVVKNYDFVNRFGRMAFAKVVTSEFKAKHTKAMGPREVKEKVQEEERIAAEFVTRALVDKVHAKIDNEKGWNSRLIPQLLNTVYYDIIREEMWEILKQFKNPVIDFGTLQKAVFYHVKQTRPELF